MCFISLSCQCVSISSPFPMQNCVCFVCLDILYFISLHAGWTLVFLLLFHLLFPPFFVFLGGPVRGNFICWKIHLICIYEDKQQEGQESERSRKRERKEEKKRNREKETVRCYVSGEEKHGQARSMYSNVLYSSLFALLLFLSSLIRNAMQVYAPEEVD